MSPVVKRSQGPTPAIPRSKASGKNRRNGSARSRCARPLGATTSTVAADGFTESSIGAGFLAAVGIARTPGWGSLSSPRHVVASSSRVDRGRRPRNVIEPERGADAGHRLVGLEPVEGSPGSDVKVVVGRSAGVAAKADEEVRSVELFAEHHPTRDGHLRDERAELRAIGATGIHGPEEAVVRRGDLARAELPLQQQEVLPPVEV